MKTQAERIVDYMREFGSITQIEAPQDLGCMRLASRISDLRRGGVPVVSEMVAVRNRWGEDVRVARYRLEEDDNATDAS